MGCKLECVCTPTTSYIDTACFSLFGSFDISAVSLQTQWSCWDYLLFKLFCYLSSHVHTIKFATDMAKRVGESSDSLSRRRPTFATRTAQEDVSRLDPEDSTHTTSDERTRLLPWPPRWARPYEPVNSSEPTENQRHSSPMNYFRGLVRRWHNGEGDIQEHETSRAATSQNVYLSADPLHDSRADKDKSGYRSRSVDEPKKLGTFSGVFVPTTLNVLSILMFLRFGFILGQAGVLGILGEYTSSQSQDPTSDTSKGCYLYHTQSTS